MWSSASLQHVRHVLGSLQLRLQGTETGLGGLQECTPWSPTFYCQMMLTTQRAFLRGISRCLGDLF